MLSHIDQAAFGRELLARLFAAGWEDSELYLTRASVLSLELRDRTATLPLYAGEQGYQLRTARDGRLFTVFSDDFSERAFDGLQAMLGRGGLALPEGFRLALPADPAYQPRDIFDPAILDVPLSEKWRRVHELADRADAQNFFVKQVPLVQYRQMLETVTYLNCAGRELRFESSGLQLLVSVNARKGEAIASGIGISLASRWDRLSIDEAAEMAAETARIKLHPRELTAKSLPAVFRPYAGALLVFLAWTLFHDPETSRFDPAFRLVDRPDWPHAPGSTPFDCEGTLTRPTLLLDGGRVCGRLTDRLGGLAVGRESTGSARLSGLTGARGVSVSNLLLEPRDAFCQLPDPPCLEILLLEVPADLRERPGWLKLQATGILHGSQTSEPCGSFPVFLPEDGFPGSIASVGSDLRFYPLGSGAIFASPSLECRNLSLR